MTATSITLFGHWICPFSVRVEFALAQRGIDYTMVEVPPRAVRPKGFVVPEEFIAHSPKLEVPMVKHNDEYLADSIPILEQLEEWFISNSLLPTDGAARSLVLARVQWLDKHLYRPMIGVYYGTDPDKIAAASDEFNQALNTVAGWLRETTWLVGDEPTIVEAIMVGMYTRLDGLYRLGLTAQIPIEVFRHREQCESLVGWQRVSWSSEQTDEFVSRFTKYREIQNSRH
jgi:glutathione S-transferase